MNNNVKGKSRMEHQIQKELNTKVLDLDQNQDHLEWLQVLAQSMETYNFVGHNQFSEVKTLALEDRIIYNLLKTKIKIQSLKEQISAFYTSKKNIDLVRQHFDITNNEENDANTGDKLFSLSGKLSNLKIEQDDEINVAKVNLFSKKFITLMHQIISLDHGKIFTSDPTNFSRSLLKCITGAYLPFKETRLPAYKLSGYPNSEIILTELQRFAVEKSNMVTNKAQKSTSDTGTTQGKHPSDMELNNFHENKRFKSSNDSSSHSSRYVRGSSRRGGRGSKRFRSNRYSNHNKNHHNSEPRAETVVCQLCGKRNHKARECFQLKSIADSVKTSKSSDGKSDHHKYKNSGTLNSYLEESDDDTDSNNYSLNNLNENNETDGTEEELELDLAQDKNQMTAKKQMLIIDTGASKCTTNDASVLFNYHSTRDTKTRANYSGPDGNKIQPLGSGRIVISVNQKLLGLDCLHIKDVNSKRLKVLLSSSALDEHYIFISVAKFKPIRDQLGVGHKMVLNVITKRLLQQQNMFHTAPPTQQNTPPTSNVNIPSSTILKLNYDRNGSESSITPSSITSINQSSDTNGQDSGNTLNDQQPSVPSKSTEPMMTTNDNTTLKSGETEIRTTQSKKSDTESKTSNDGQKSSADGSAKLDTSSEKKKRNIGSDFEVSEDKKRPKGSTLLRIENGIESNTGPITRSKSASKNSTGKAGTSTSGETENVNMFGNIEVIINNLMETLQNNYELNDFSYQDVIKSPVWVSAMKKELIGLIQKGVIVQIVTDEGQEYIGKEYVMSTRWVLVEKVINGKNGDETIAKARLVIRGYEEINDEDESNYAPTSSRTQLRLLCALICLDGDFEVCCYDFTQAFLNSQLEKPMYIRFKDHKEKKVIAKIERNLYGLKSAPKRWFITLSNYLKSLNFKNSVLAESMFVRKDSKGNIVDIILLFVDDLLIISRQSSKLIKQLESKFDGKITADIDTIKFNLLGLQIERTIIDGKTKDIQISSENYIQNAVKSILNNELFQKVSAGMKRQITTVQLAGFKAPDERYNMDGPMSEKKARQLKKLIQMIIGKLIYIMVSCRLDIYFGVVNLARNQSLNKQYFIMIKHAINYLKKTNNFSIHFKRTNFAPGKLEIICWVDASKNNTVDKKSAIGCMLFISGIDGCISYKSETTKVADDSTCKAELCAISLGLKESLYLKNLMKDLFGFKTCSITIKSDSQSAVSFIQNRQITKENKHYPLELFYLRQYYETGVFDIEKVEGQENYSDILTKNVDASTHYRHVGKLMNTTKKRNQFN